MSVHIYISIHMHTYMCTHTHVSLLAHPHLSTVHDPPPEGLSAPEQEAANTPRSLSLGHKPPPPSSAQHREGGTFWILTSPRLMCQEHSLQLSEVCFYTLFPTTNTDKKKKKRIQAAEHCPLFLRLSIYIYVFFNLFSISVVLQAHRREKTQMDQSRQCWSRAGDFAPRWRFLEVLEDLRRQERVFFFLGWGGVFFFLSFSPYRLGTFSSLPLPVLFL